MGYTESVLESLINDFGARIILVHWDHKKLSKHKLSILCDQVIPRSEIDLVQIKHIINNYNPNLIFVSGWMDKIYLSATRYARKKKILVVAGMDTPWTGSVKQYISSILLKKYWRNHFNYLWVPGKRQINYAHKLGFIGKCRPNLYSGRVDLFNKSWERSKNSKKEQYPHQLLFIGRLEKIKGIDMLVNIFLQIKKELKNDWRLVIAGSGTLETSIPGSPDIENVGFKTQKELTALMGDSGAFCLPSLWEPWGVVIHEAAAAGLPLLLSDECGAAEAFLEEDENGFIFKAGDENRLKENLIKLFEFSDKSLYRMAEKSYKLSHKITPQLSAETLMDIFDENRH